MRVLVANKIIGGIHMSKKKLYDEDGNVVEGAKAKKPFYKRWWFIALVVIIVLGLFVGGDEEAETADSTESTEETVSMGNENEAEEVAEEDLYEFDEVIADDEDFKATLLSIEHINDEQWDEERIEVRFDVENKRDENIEVQARTVSLDGRMIDESLLMMSQEVAPGKVAEAVLVIQDFEGKELPELEGDFEMTLRMFDWEDYEYEKETEVNVNLD